MKKVPFPGTTPYPRAVRLWEPMGAPRAVILISHGMAEHIDRYDRLGKHLTARGYLVAGYNHLGHGEEAPIKGWYAKQDGWGHAVEDLHQVMSWLQAQYPSIPHILLGHSMGSFLSREFVLRHPDSLDALVLCGTGWYPKQLAKAGLLPAKILCALGREKKKSKFLDTLAFSSNNKPFKKKDGLVYDWLSRDKAEVQKYADDPLCGFVFTAGGFRDLFNGLVALSDVNRLKRLPKDLPVHIISGDMDPVGGMGEGVRTVRDQYKDAGLTDVSMVLYEGGRHEIFNETNRNEVMDELADWLDALVSSRERSV